MYAISTLYPWRVTAQTLNAFWLLSCDIPSYSNQHVFSARTSARHEACGARKLSADLVHCFQGESSIQLGSSYLSVSRPGINSHVPYPCRFRSGCSHWPPCTEASPSERRRYIPHVRASLFHCQHRSRGHEHRLCVHATPVEYWIARFRSSPGIRRRRRQVCKTQCSHLIPSLAVDICGQVFIPDVLPSPSC